MKRLITMAFSLIGAIALLVSGPLALAAPKMPAPVAGEVPQHIGIIEFMDLGKGIIVISDMEYALSDKLSVNGKSGGARQSLKKGMRVKFTFAFVAGKARPVIDEIWYGQ